VVRNLKLITTPGKVIKHFVPLSVDRGKYMKKLLNELRNKFSKDYCHICKEPFKNYQGYKSHIMNRHTFNNKLILNHQENMKILGEQYE